MFWNKGTCRDCGAENPGTDVYRRCRDCRAEFAKIGRRADAAAMDTLYRYGRRRRENRLALTAAFGEYLDWRDRQRAEARAQRRRERQGV